MESTGTLENAGGVGPAATVKNYTVGGRPVTLERVKDGRQDKSDADEPGEK
jgi:hypothetical protein